MCVRIKNKLNRRNWRKSDIPEAKVPAPLGNWGQITNWTDFWSGVNSSVVPAKKVTVTHPDGHGEQRVLSWALIDLVTIQLRNSKATSPRANRPWPLEIRVFHSHFWCYLRQNGRKTREKGLFHIQIQVMCDFATRGRRASDIGQDFSIPWYKLHVRWMTQWILEWIPYTLLHTSSILWLGCEDHTMSSLHDPDQIPALLQAFSSRFDAGESNPNEHILPKTPIEHEKDL